MKVYTTLYHPSGYRVVVYQTGKSYRAETVKPDGKKCNYQSFVTKARMLPYLALLVSSGYSEKEAQ